MNEGGQIRHNTPLFLVLASRLVSSFGDEFFNLAIVWVVYAQSGSILQTALVQIVWHLSDVLFGPLAGVLADRRDRKSIIVGASVLAAVTVGLVAVSLFRTGTIALPLAIAAIFVLNSLTTMTAPAQASLLPALVDRGGLTAVWGWLSSASQVVVLLGSAAAGVVIGVAGAAWAVLVDAVTFAVAAVLTGIARLPPREPAGTDEAALTFWQDARAGWQFVMSEPVLRGLVLLLGLVNVASLTGPLYPALIATRLTGGAAAYGGLQAVSIAGGIAGGALAGWLERRFGAGVLLAAGWALAGLATVGVGLSTELILTLGCAAALAFGLTVGGIAASVMLVTLVPDDYRGRTTGLARAMSVVAIPLATALGGWAADRVGVVPLFVFAGLWTVAVALLAWLTPAVRTARV